MARSSFIVTGATAACIFIVSLGCARKADTTSAILAEVGDRVITVVDLEREITRRQEARKPISGKEALLDEMVSREAALFRVRESGLDSDRNVRRMVENLLIGQLKDRELEGKIRGAKVTDVDLKATYESEIDRFTQPEKTRLAIIKMELPPAASSTKQAEVLQRLERARTLALANPPSGGRGAASQGFGKIAIDYSEDQASRYRGGDLGWLDASGTLYHWPQDVLAAGFALEKGSISEAVHADHAVYLVKKSDHRSESITPFEEVKVSLRQTALAKKRLAIKSAFGEENLRLAAVKTHAEHLDSISLPAIPALAAARQSEPPAIPHSDR